MPGKGKDREESQTLACYYQTQIWVEAVLRKGI